MWKYSLLLLISGAAWGVDPDCRYWTKIRAMEPNKERMAMEFFALGAYGGIAAAKGGMVPNPNGLTPWMDAECIRAPGEPIAHAVLGYFRDRD